MAIEQSENEAPPVRRQASQSIGDDEKPDLRKHMEATYFNLRYGLLLIACALLLVPLFGRAFGGLPFQRSLSAYYHAAGGAYRDEFVGALIATAALLYLYKGFSKTENYALNMAAVFAVGVAMIPTHWGSGPRPAFSIHGTAAVLFFACIAFVCLFCAADTLGMITDKPTITKYKRLYRTLGILMILSPLVAVVVSTILQRPGEDSTKVLYIEEFAVAIFALYWLTKTAEMRKTHAESLALRGEAKRETVPAGDGKTKDAVVPA